MILVVGASDGAVAVGGHALLMLKPDAVQQRLTGRALGWLEARGFSPMRYRELVLVPKLRGVLYDSTRTGGRLDWDLNAVLYALAPVRALLLHHDDLDAAERLSGLLKGSFVPTRAQLGTLRHDVGALNPICNLTHASDDEDRTRYEAEVLFGDRSLGVERDELTRLALARQEAPAPARLWSTVWSVVCAVIGEDQGEALPWPAPDAGPTRPAMTTVASTLAAVSERSVDPSVARLLSGARTGEVSYDEWDYRAGQLRGWSSYLTYTTLRYLDLCLEPVA